MNRCWSRLPGVRRQCPCTPRHPVPGRCGRVAAVAKRLHQLRTPAGARGARDGSQRAQGALGAGRGAGERWLLVGGLSRLRRAAGRPTKLGSILGFVAAYILGADPEGRGVPTLIPAVRATYTTKRHDMDPGNRRPLGCSTTSADGWPVAGTRRTASTARAAVAAGARQLMCSRSAPRRRSGAHRQLFGRSAARAPRLTRPI